MASRPATEAPGVVVRIIRPARIVASEKTFRELLWCENGFRRLVTIAIPDQSEFRVHSFPGEIDGLYLKSEPDTRLPVPLRQPDQFCRQPCRSRETA